MNMVPFLWAPFFGACLWGPSLGPFFWALHFRPLPTIPPPSGRLGVHPSDQSATLLSGKKRIGKFWEIEFFTKTGFLVIQVEIEEV